MFATIMNLPVDWSLLDQAGVSEDGIGFLKSMLVIDPWERPSDATLLKHPWLQAAIDAPNNENKDELDASQLSLRDSADVTDGLEEDLEDEADYHDFRGAEAPNTIRSPPNMLHPQPPNRLFGEIGSSALRSSGVFGHQAHGALGMPTTLPPGAGSYDPSELGFRNSGVSNQDSHGALKRPAVLPPTTGSYDPSSSNASYTDAQHAEFSSADATENQYRDSSVHYPDLDQSRTNPTAAPSLLGAESLVDKFHMGSPEPGKSREMSPALAGSKRHNEDTCTEDEASTSKRPKTQYSHWSPDHQRPSVEPPTRHDSDVSLLPTAVNSPASATDSIECEKTSHNEESRVQSASNTAGKEPFNRESTESQNLPPTAPTSIAGSQPATTTKDDSNTFVKPPVRFGNLIPIRGSISTVPRVIISSRATTFGRDKKCNFVHADAMEDRIPKNAVDIQMWYPGIEKDVTAGKADIESHKDLVAVISTRASRYIKVNGVRVIRGKDRKYFGRLRTGDIITIFEFPEGQTPKTDKDKEFLRFRAEFFIGLSKEVRKPGEPFVVETGDLNVQVPAEKKSRQSSGASTIAVGSVSRASGKADGSAVGTAVAAGGSMTRGSDKSETSNSTPTNANTAAQ